MGGRCVACVGHGGARAPPDFGKSLILTIGAHPDLYFYYQCAPPPFFRVPSQFSQSPSAYGYEYLKFVILKCHFTVYKIGLPKIKSLSPPMIVGQLYREQNMTCTKKDSYAFVLDPQNPSFSPSAFQTIIAMIQQASQFQLATFIVSVVCIVSLFVLKEFVQPQFRRLKLPMGLNKLPLPFDLLVVSSLRVLLCILVEYFYKRPGLINTLPSLNIYHYVLVSTEYE